jgi:DNA polymerase-1
VTILQPTRGVSEIARIGPAEVRERYGVEPEQVPDFIALRGDPSDRLPGAPGVGPKKAAEVLGQYGSLEAALEAGRFAANAEELRLYHRIATLDASAPIPALDDQTPSWAKASALVSSWGIGQLAGRLEERAK